MKAYRDSVTEHDNI